ncbi:MAG: hypothetical protein KAJ44_04150 [Thermoplasmatales archaeon]|nr:hypothetical protein [Thermoplasmatales archaeon]
MPKGEKTDRVFINCPFDQNYKPLFEAIIFTIYDCGFRPICALEDEDEEIRLTKIVNMIRRCRYGIHDISRTELDEDTDLPRFNMPFELGLFIGCKKYGNKNKSYLVLDREQYRFREFISDISGIDVKSHNTRPETAIRIVRDWLRTVSRRTTIPSGSTIWTRYQNFRIELPDLCIESELNINDLHFLDYSHLVTQWLRDYEGLEIEEID